MTDILHCENSSIITKKYNFSKYYMTYYYKHHADIMTYKKKTNKIYYEKYKQRYHCVRCNLDIAPSNLRKHIITNKHNTLSNNNINNIFDTQKNIFIY